MFYNRHTISIGTLVRLMDNRDLRLVKRYRVWLPKFMLARAFERLMYEVAETLNKSALDQEIIGGVMRAKLYNKAFNLYPILLDIVSLTWDRKHLDMVYELTGIKMEKIEDRTALESEMKRLQDKYKELLIPQKDGEGMSFAQVIISTEIVLELNISRDTTLYEFQYYMKAATEKLRQLEKTKDVGGY
jgi:hypothetical protein